MKNKKFRSKYLRNFIPVHPETIQEAVDLKEEENRNVSDVSLKNNEKTKNFKANTFEIPSQSIQK